jgi:hypothetical protein
MMSGTSIIQQAIIAVWSRCTHQEFLSLLRPVLLGTEMVPWTATGGSIARGREFPSGLLRMYLYPIGLSQTDMNMLTGVRASFKNRLNHVLHRIIWYDWFRDSGP